MTKHMGRYQLTRKEIARFTCLDCGVNVIEQGEFCMLRSNIWEQQLGLGWDDNMCIACIKRRIGRKLTMLDFISFPYVEGYPLSEVYSSRLGHKQLG
jgi:hypothetical protein